jgi:hypothetical protein
MSKRSAPVLASVLFLIASASLADGFGWQGQSFRFEALALVFGGRYATPEAIAPILKRARTCAEETYGEDRGTPPVLERLLRRGWVTTDDKRINDEQWTVFSLLALCPDILPELAFGKEADMLAPIVVTRALSRVPNRRESVLRHFLTFGRSLGAKEGYRRCRDVVQDYAVDFDATLINCSPVHLILLPAEVEQLNLELRTLLPRMTDEDRDDLAGVAALVSAAAATKQAVFFQGFD